MANIKLKDLLNEISTQGGMVSRSPWAVNEEEKEAPKIDVKELVSKINSFNSIGESIYGKGNLKEVAESLSSICLLYTSPSPRDRQKSRMPSSA